MQTTGRFTSSLFTVAISSLTSLGLLQAQTEPPADPTGRVEGTGTHFEVP